jgi:hypothetical protein
MTADLANWLWRPPPLAARPERWWRVHFSRTAYTAITTGGHCGPGCAMDEACWLANGGWGRGGKAGPCADCRKRGFSFGDWEPDTAEPVAPGRYEVSLSCIAYMSADVTAVSAPIAEGRVKARSITEKRDSKVSPFRLCPACAAKFILGDWSTDTVEPVDDEG